MLHAGGWHECRVQNNPLGLSSTWQLYTYFANRKIPIWHSGRTTRMGNASRLPTIRHIAEASDILYLSRCVICGGIGNQPCRTPKNGRNSGLLHPKSKGLRGKPSEAFGGTGAVRSVAIDGRHGSRPSRNKAKANYGVSGPKGNEMVSPNAAHLAPRRERGRPARICSGVRARCPRSFK